MKKSLLIFLIFSICFAQQTFSQSLCDDAKIISTPGATEKYVYQTSLDKNGDEKKLHIAVTRPNDRLPGKKRPLIIGLQGSAFVDTCFLEPCYVKYSDGFLKPNFAARGFVTASIQYRLTSPLSPQILKITDEKLKEVEYKAVQDARLAIRYIFENADKFGVDTDNVFLIGTSAGAITALSAVYTNEAPADLQKKFGALAKREKIKAVVSLSGAIRDLSRLGGSGDKTPLLVVHGSDDRVVPFEKGLYFGMRNLTPVFGGKAIYDEAVRLKIPVKGYFYEFGHAYPSKYQTEIGRHINDFLRSHMTCADGKKLTSR